MSGAPIDKAHRYDRQLRMWGQSGQEALEAARILLVNATAAGCETLKNLVLPGVGHFTIVDAECMTEADAGANFFVHAGDIGANRAETCVRLLSELNTDVVGRAIRVENVMAEDATFPLGYSLVIACDLNSTTTATLAARCWSSNTPLILLQSRGFYGVCSLQVPEHCVVESHPESAEDLRLTNPWAELRDYAMRMDPAGMLDGHERGHTPWPVLLIRAIETWRLDLGKAQGEFPQTYAEKNALRDLLKVEAVQLQLNDAENYDQAVAAVLRVCQPARLPGNLLAVFNDPKCHKIDATSTPFWVTAAAVRAFYETHGALPVPGAIPDMKSDTERYVALQTIYRHKAMQDVDAVVAQAQQLIQTAGLNAEGVSAAYVKDWCRNAAYVRVIRTRAWNEVWGAGGDGWRRLAKACLEGDDTEDAEEDAAVVLAFMACEKVDRPVNGAEDADMAAISDADRIVSVALSLLAPDGATTSKLTSYSCKVLQEMNRVFGPRGSMELHHTSSVLGGIVGQEASKLLTRHYVPVGEMGCIVVWNGVRSKCTVIV